MIGFKDRPLRRDIAAVLAVKLAVVAALWFAFVRGHVVAVDADRATSLLGASAHAKPETGEPRRGQ